MGISIIISAILAISGLVFKETITNVIKNFSSNLSKKWTTIIFVILLIIAISVPFAISFVFDNYNSETTTVKDSANENPNVNFKIKNKYKIKNKAGGGYNHSKKDSIKMTERVQFWVYQIGIPKRKTSELWDALESVKDISNIYVFRKSKKEFYIVKDDGYSKKAINDSLNSFKSKLDSIVNRVCIVDLATFCKKKEKIIEEEKLRNKKDSMEIRCYVCD